MLVIREARPDDAMGIAEAQMRSWERAYEGIIPRQAIDEANANRPEKWEKILSEPNDTLVALEGSRVVGLLGMSACRDDDLPGVGEIVAIYLHPEAWGKGYGRRLLEAGLEALWQRGYAEAALWTLVENHGARAFYEKCGMHLDGATKEFVIGKPLMFVRYRVHLQKGSDRS